MTTVAIMQPQFLPRTRYMAMLDQADLFVLLDTVPVDTKSWQTRAQIRARDGNVIWLSIPTNAKRGMPLNQVRVADNGWQNKHRRSIAAAYSHTQGWDSIRGLTYWHTVQGAGLTNLTEWAIMDLARLLGITTPIMRASDLPEYVDTDRIGRIAHILHAANATSFLATPGSTFLHDHSHVGEVPIEWFEYDAPEYPQPPHRQSEPHLSVVDLIAHSGPESLNVIRGNPTGNLHSDT